MSRPALPQRRNTTLSASDTDHFDSLIDRRRLGQANLPVKSAQKLQGGDIPKFDYAHLRVPLPSSLEGTQVHVKIKGVYPGYYFLMRRSEDGFVSASGMFKAAFPWATTAEESIEKAHLRTKGKHLTRESAGNIWVDPSIALLLAEEYGMAKWVVALLSPDPVAKSARDHKTEIANPPAVDIPLRYIQLATGEAVSAAPTPKLDANSRKLSMSVQSTSPASSIRTTNTVSPRRSSRSTTPSETPVKSNSSHSQPDPTSQHSRHVLNENLTDSHIDGETRDDEVEDEEEDDDDDEEDEDEDQEEDDEEKADDNEQSGTELDQTEEDGDDVLFGGQPASVEEVKQSLKRAEEMTARAREHDRIAKSAEAIQRTRDITAERKRKAEEDPEDAPALHDVVASVEPGRAYAMFKKLRLIVPVAPNESIETQERRTVVKKRALFGLAATLVVGAVLPYLS